MKMERRCCHCFVFFFLFFTIIWVFSSTLGVSASTIQFADGSKTPVVTQNQSASLNNEICMLCIRKCKISKRGASAASCCSEAKRVEATTS